MSDFSTNNLTFSWLDNKRILIVEDEESNFELLKAMLRLSTVTIVWARNGIEAIELCEKNTFHLIMMDIKMPEMNGYDAVLKIREMGIMTPVIAQTAYARIEDEEEILRRGFDDYISKPIVRKNLYDLMEKHIRKP